MKYRVEAKLICLSDGVEWNPHSIEFDTEVEPRSIVHMRFDSIRAVLVRMIGKREKLPPNLNKYPLAYSPISEASGCSGENS